MKKRNKKVFKEGVDKYQISDKLSPTNVNEINLLTT